MVQISKLATSDKTTRRIMLYGDSGSGKTQLVGSIQDVPEMADVLVVDIDSGSSTLNSRGDISATVARLPKDVEAILWLFIRRDPSVAQFKTLVLDGFSEMAKRDLAEIAREEAAGGKKGRDELLNQLQDYKLSKARILRIARMARDIEGINLVMTLWAKKSYPKLPGTDQANKNAQPTGVSPDLSDSVRDTVAGYFDDVFYLFQDPATDVRYLVTGNYGPVTAKVRDPAIAARLTMAIDGKTVPMVRDPKFITLYNAYKGV